MRRRDFATGARWKALPLRGKLFMPRFSLAGFLMLSLSGRPSRLCSGVSRREFLRVGGLAVGGLSLPTLLASGGHKPPEVSAIGHGKARAKSCLLIFMDGGPSHLEMWDMKPDA